jgi:hypothetical protein
MHQLVNNGLIATVTMVPSGGRLVGWAERTNGESLNYATDSNA